MPVDALDISENLKKQILLDLCQRNHYGEMVYLSNDSKMLRTGIRFLGLSQQCLVIDHPSMIDETPSLPKDGFIHIELSWEKQRYMFVTRVQSPTKWVLNDLITVNALCVNIPNKLIRAQRRKCYRLGLSHMPTATINLRPVDRSRHSVVGTMVNISEGGTSILTNTDAATELAENDVYLASFSLPDENNCPVSYYIAGTITQIQKVPERKRIRIGIKWDLNPCDYQIQASLGRFIVAEQLRMLRRKQATASKASGVG